MRLASCTTGMKSWLCADMYVTPDFFTASRIWSASREARAHRLLAQHVLARRARVEDRRAVQVVRQADVDGVDLVAHLLEHDLPVGERARRVEAAPAELLGALLHVLLRHLRHRHAADLVACFG